MSSVLNRGLPFHCLDRVLRLCVGTWEGAPQSFTANMLNGIARLVVAYGDTLKDDTFQERLSRISLKELARTAKDRRAGSLGYSEAIVTCYNKRTRFGLSMEKLYSHNKARKNEPASRILNRSKKDAEKASNQPSATEPLDKTEQHQLTVDITALPETEDADIKQEKGVL